eukprot:TRINITY_DN18886_c0_g1_i1.p1 TRINITY_DN18886_c0_g1~~TRINITY_DN18886_c0_g1_i1.p1  ORF type:complete len:341 (-),score=42.12 TRINITY_DN18886_c0_g1_i1:456-1478(-)
MSTYLSAIDRRRLSYALSAFVLLIGALLLVVFLLMWIDLPGGWESETVPCEPSSVSFRTEWIETKGNLRGQADAEANETRGQQIGWCTHRLVHKGKRGLLPFEQSIQTGAKNTDCEGLQQMDWVPLRHGLHTSMALNMARMCGCVSEELPEGHCYVQNGRLMPNPDPLERELDRAYAVLLAGLAFVTLSVLRFVGNYVHFHRECQELRRVHPVSGGKQACQVDDKSMPSHQVKLDNATRAIGITDNKAIDIAVTDIKTCSEDRLRGLADRRTDFAALALAARPVDPMISSLVEVHRKKLLQEEGGQAVSVLEKSASLTSDLTSETHAPSSSDDDDAISVQ